MSEEIMENNTQATDASTTSEQNQESQQKTYTQEEFDNHMAKMRKSIESKFEKKFSELGDIEELKKLKSQAEKREEEEALKRGEFEKILQEKAAKWETEIQQRDQVIKEYKVNTPILDAASRYRAVAPEQVKHLLANQVRLNESGDVEVVGTDNTVRYSDQGTPLSVDDLVKEFLDSNPHFVSGGPSTANTKNNTGNSQKLEFDVSQLDMKNPAHREKYRKAKEDGLV